jgi:hypothetical protein
MHTLSIDIDERKTVLFVLAVIAVGLNSLFQNLAESFQIKVPPVPSAFAIYGLLYASFENWIWRWEFLRRFWISKVPILMGRWETTMRSSLDNFEEELSATLVISQSWSKIHVYFDGNEAMSSSLSASIIYMGPTRISLTYLYQSERKPEFTGEEYVHFGTARLSGVLDELGRGMQMVGSYFTDRSRNSYGKINLKRVS